MGKVSPVSIKYMVCASFEAAGALEKPDVIGALFGQTEGLLGDELELRELQKEGKIGRIDVELKNEGGKTIGEIKIPTSLDKAETALIAAAIETITRIGPTDAKIEVKKIEDIRGEKRGFIVDRAKKLLAGIEGSSETREMADNLKEQSRMSELQDYGSEKLPAGDISGHEIIVVEGRADVVTLLKNGIKNVIGMTGTKLPETIKELSYDKEITLFIDGDRGGRLIAKNVADNARIDFIAVAPDGKEVEELVGKEILIALRRKVTAAEFFRGERESFRERSYGYRDNRGFQDNRRYGYRDDRGYRDNRGFQDNRRYEERAPERSTYAEPEKKVEEKPIEAKVEEKKIEIVEKKAESKGMGEVERKKLETMMNEIEGSKDAYLLDENLEIIKKVASTSVKSSLMRTKKEISVIVMDGLVTMPIVKMAEEKGIKAIAARNFAFTDTNIKLLSL